MKRRRWGRIIYTSSVLGLGGAAGRGVYCATKSALLGLARARHMELGPSDHRQLHRSGPLPHRSAVVGPHREATSRLCRATALQRWGRPEELQGPALLLASEAGSYITGSVLVVDGGIMAKVF